jgi:hypothetical protein
LEAVNASAVADLQAFVTLVVDRYFPKGWICLFHRKKPQNY